MRSALLCVFFALIVHNGSRATDSDFRPIPIPLDEWNYEKRAGRVGTLHEAIHTDAPPAVAALPAHYWEDALRHSVYLTLVRDKIDQLIAKGVVVAPNSKPEQSVSKEVDDHDLWEKIKKAPFDRIQEEEHATFGDVTIMAKGRLMDENGGFRFTEDERSREDCSDDKCMESVKAFWSVKRVRQRDVETSPGRYHYELTFSVNSQPPKKQKKPFENPVRTFTVRENAPDTVVGIPQEHPVNQPVRPQMPRPQRAVWFHKNIAPKHYSQGRYYNQGLDRIFSSFFSDDDTHAEPPPRYKPNPYAPPPMYPQYSKVGFVGLPSDQHHQKRLMPYPYKPHHMYKYRPPLPPPPMGHIQSHYVEHPYIQQQPPDHRYISPSNIVKTTRPAVLPTPPMPQINATMDDVSQETLSTNGTIIIEETTKIPEMPTVHPPAVHKTYTKPRPMKVSYFSEHVRPPIYNAPPGVFVTMDKKPFKPMPPLKYHHHHQSKPVKKPVDFRPSPQLIDGQFSYPSDTEVDSAFKPILVNHTDSESEEDIEITHSIRHGHKPPRKQTGKKPPKKHENIKSQRITTTAPDIITVNNDSGEDDNMHWADVLSAFSKTTPMQNGKKSESTTEMTSSITKKKYSTSTTEAYKEPSTTSTTTSTTTTTTTPGPKKRTRPPHKFVKPEKVKKHKRITTTTTSTTNAPETSALKKPSDLTPQASSAATNAPKSWKPKNKTTTVPPTAPATLPPVTSSTTTTTTPSTPEITTTKQTSTSETTPITEATVKAIEPKNKSRFRISTLMQHGTSVKHDRWSVNTTSDKKAAVPTAGKHPPRRKGSNFQGYASSTSKYSPKEDFDSHRQKHPSGFESMTRSTTEPVTVAQTSVAPMQSGFEEIPVHFNSESTSAYSQNRYEEDEDVDDDDDIDNIDNASEEDIEVKRNNDDEHEIEDHSEFIFGLSSTLPNERTNEIGEEESVVTEQTVITTSHAVPKNKTKCKKKKHHHLAPTTTVALEENEEDPTTTIASPVPTKSSTGIDLLDEILGSFTYDESTQKATTKASQQELEEEESENHEKYLKIDEDFEEFLGNLGGKHRHSDEKDDVDYEDEDPEAPPEEESPYDNEDVNENGRDSSDKEYEDYRERSYSLLELMAME